MTQTKLIMTHLDPKKLTMIHYEQQKIDYICFWAQNLCPNMVKICTCSDWAETLDVD